jgi:RNA polymerase sigma factor (sigma-70 family)
MPSTELNTLFKHIQRVTAAPAAAFPDRFLLEQFLAERNEAAFRELLRRHGPMVLGVCRSMLRQEQDAEDAFQATFLVLARKADAIRKHDAVGSWLHGVAYQVARNLLASLRRRRRLEPRTSAMSVPDPLLDISVRELHHAVTEELQQLPEKYRAALVLCYLEGKTQALAARELGCSEGVLRGRVNRGRAELQSRLKRRGLAPSVGLVTGVLPAGRAVLRAELADATVAAGLRYAAGGVAGGLVSAQALRLADGVVRAMFATKAAVAGGLVMALSVLVSIVSGLARPAELPAEPPALAMPAAPKPDLEPVALNDEPMVLWPVERQVWNTAFAPDGKTLVSVGGAPHRPSEITFWDPLTGKARLRLREKTGSRSVAFSADGKTMATAGWEEPTASVRDAATGRVLRVLHGHTAGVNGVAFSPDGQTLATSAFDRTVRLWDVATGRLKHTLRGHTQDGVYAVAFSPDGRSLASCGADKTARLWDAATGKEKLTLTGHQEGVELAIFSPDSRQVATACWDRTIKLWDAATGEETASLTGHVLPILSIAFSPDGNLLASGSGKWAGIADLPDRPGEVKLWNVAGRKELASFDGHDNVVFSVAFAPDGKTFASAGLDHTIKVWDVAQRKEHATMRCGEGPVAEVRSVHLGVYAPDGKVLALAAEDDAKVVLIDPVTGDVRHVLKGHTDPILALAISPDGKTLASGGWDTTVRLWDVARSSGAAMGCSHRQGTADPRWPQGFSAGPRFLSGGQVPRLGRRRPVGEDLGPVGCEKRGHAARPQGRGACRGLLGGRQDAGLGRRRRHGMPLGRHHRRRTGHPEGAPARWRGRSATGIGSPGVRPSRPVADRRRRGRDPLGWARQRTGQRAAGAGRSSGRPELRRGWTACGDLGRRNSPGLAAVRGASRGAPGRLARHRRARLGGGLLARRADPRRHQQQ